MKALISPRELADAIGVSESSIKRWVDNDVVKATKTAGGHRRISISEAVRFLRERQISLVNPSAIGMNDVESLVEISSSNESDKSELLYEYLREGQAEAARGLLVSMYLGGRSIAQIVDSSVTGAMSRLGELWFEDDCGIFWEHRATEITISSISRLRMIIPPRGGGAPVAVGGAPAGDPYILPSLCAATVLESQGVNAVNLGPDTPIHSLELASNALKARLVWVSVSVLDDPDQLQQELSSLASLLEEASIPIIVGGSQSDRLALPDTNLCHVGTSMGELEAMIKGLQLAVH